MREQTRYSRLANITEIINTKLELREVLQHVTQAISEEIVTCNSVGIFLPHEDGTFRGFAGKPEMMTGMTLESQIIDPEIDLLAKEVIETQKTIYIPDTSKDSRPDPRSVEAFQIKSLLGLPISFEQELFGLVFLFDYGSPMHLTESEIQSVEAYVNMAAVAIRNASNLKQKEDLLAEKQLLLDVTRDLSMCSSVQESLDKCFFYLKKVLDSRNISVHLLGSPEKQAVTSSRRDSGADWTEQDWDKALAEAGKEDYATMIRHVADTRQTAALPDNEEAGMLMIPLVSTGEVLGVLTAAGNETAVRHFGKSQIRLATSIADATAPVLSNLSYMDQLESRVEQRTSELAAANERVTSVIESITDGFFTLNEEWEFTYINRHQYLPDGITREDVLGKNVWEVFPESVNSIIYREFHRAMSERVSVNFEIPSVTDDHWFEVIAYPYDEGICCLFKNIFEKKKYEKELRRLSNLNLIGQMAAGISHEIRNPMTTVRGFLQLLKKQEDLKEHHQHFGLMIEELDRANSIITEFLSVGNTKTSRLEMLDLNKILQDIAPLIKIDTLNQNKQIRFNTNDIPELLLNRTEIRQLIVNLYRNGLEAMQPGQELTISTYMDGDGCAVLAVQDEGEGIRPEVLEKLGTPFYTTKDEGTGLGLGICYAIAARHHAKIEIQTGPGGTAFLTRFPC